MFASTKITKHTPLPTPAANPTTAQNAHRVGTFIADGTLEHEDPNELATVYAEYIADYLPTPGIETELVRQLSMATHRLRRLDRIENAVHFSDATAHTRHEANVILGEAFDKAWTTTEKILKARAAAERSFNRVYKDLEARKKNRTAPRAVPGKLEVEIDTRHQPAPSTKRSHWEHKSLVTPATPETGHRPLATDHSAPATPTAPSPDPCTSTRRG